jgi:hypothetical protein
MQGRADTHGEGPKRTSRGNATDAATCSKGERDVEEMEELKTLGITRRQRVDGRVGAARWREDGAEEDGAARASLLPSLEGVLMIVGLAVVWGGGQ